MDLNYLLHRQQIERSRAQSAECIQARRAHAELAELYEQAIKGLNEGEVRFGSIHGAAIH